MIGLCLCFKVSFNARHSRAGGFFVFCLYNFMALGFSTEAMATLLTPKYMTYFLVPLIIFNTAVCSLQITLEPRVYKYRYGFLVYYSNLQQATRTIVFNTKSHLSLNAGILIAWIALSCCTIPLFSFIMHRRDMATAAREAASSSGTATQNHDNHTTHSGIDGISPGRGTEADVPLKVTPLNEKHSDHDYDPLAPQSRSYEMFDVER
ncbi:hypothetical protein BS47DRAFT_616650 [Hydnum rufescens UP504]|uniref:DUF3533 domain-containing protein n=1 Tax=Hydnum rufescens UP504 TaxID=1448309 RepID=A0A9P6AF43_9AGAM|nr:hypothetical protein BS47DRAFT_616650 [Hydnum rufescens UP504]